LSLAPSLTVYNLYPVFPLFHFKSFNLFFLFSSEALAIKSDAFVAYYGSHSSRGVKQAEIVFPGILPLEQHNSKFFFSSGDSSKFSFILPSPSNTRNIFEVISTLIFFFGFVFENNILALSKLKKISTLNNFLFLSPSKFYIDFNNLNEIKSSVCNNFKTNILMRNSRILSLAASRFRDEIGLTIFN